MLFKIFCVSAITASLIAAPALGQETSGAETVEEILSTQPEDEVIAYGKRDWGHHDGMKAFFDGDFETAEIEFEKEFLSLKRGESARENAAIDAANQSFRAEQFASTTGTSGGSSGQGGNASAGFEGGVGVDAGFSSGFNNKRATGKSVLNDGVVTYEDFAFSKYMSGLSEIKLGKVSEAKKSLQQSLKHNEYNFDARMRLGLIYVQEDDFEGAAKQLEKLASLRKRCKIRKCDDMKYINDSSVTLARAITTTVQSRQ